MDKQILSFLKFVNKSHPIKAEDINTCQITVLRKKIRSSKDQELIQKLEQELIAEASCYLTLLFENLDELYTKWTKSKQNGSQDNDFTLFAKNVIANSKGQYEKKSLIDIFKILANAYFYLVIENEAYPNVFNPPPKRSGDTLQDFIEDGLTLVND